MKTLKRVVPKRGWDGFTPGANQGLGDPVVSERGQSFGKWRGAGGELPGCLQKGVLEPGWSWDHGQGKKTPGPATGLSHQLRAPGQRLLVSVLPGA